MGGVEGRLSDSTLEERASVLQSKYNSSYKPAGSSLKRDDSTDDLIASIKANARKRVEAEAAKAAAKAAAAAAGRGDSCDSSGRSTPEHLKKFEGSAAATTTSSCSATESKRLRTFSETLKMLDDDIVADLNV